MKHYISASDAAKKLGCTIRHIQRLCTKNILDSHKKDDRWLVRRVSVSQYDGTDRARASTRLHAIQLRQNRA